MDDDKPSKCYSENGRSYDATCLYGPFANVRICGCDHDGVQKTIDKMYSDRKQREFLEKQRNNIIKKGLRDHPFIKDKFFR